MLSTEPANRPEAERGIRLAYQCAGLRPPKRIVWCGSPLNQGLRLSIPVRDKRMSVWDRFSASVRAGFCHNVWPGVRSVLDSVLDSVSFSVMASLGAGVWHSVWHSVGRSINDGCGNYDAARLGVYDYFSEVLGLREQTAKLAGLWLQAEHAGWWLPHRDICWVSERHNILRRDERGRLHCMDGPAVAYPDGRAIYAVHGVEVPAHVIEQRDQITPKAIHKEHNVEVRRVMLEFYGFNRYLHDTQAIHSDRYGDLYEIDMRGWVMNVVCVRDSTPEADGQHKVHWLRGDPRARTAHEAVASTFGMRRTDYKPIIET